MANALSPSCCCCPSDEFTPDGLWTGWDGAPEVAGIAGAIGAGESRSLTIDRPTGNWCVDIQATLTTAGAGAKIQVAELFANLSRTDTTATISPRVGRCSSTTNVGPFWLRIAESTDTGANVRRRVIEVWDTDPKTGVDPILTECQNGYLPEDWTQPDTVTITIASGTATMKIGVVRVSGTADDRRDCPEVSCSQVSCGSGGPLLYLATNVRVICSGFGFNSLTYTYTGKVANGMTGATYGPGTWSETLAVDLSSLNGTHSLILKKDGVALTAGEVAAEIEAVRARGLCPAEASRYQWTFPGYDIRECFTASTGGTSAGLNFKGFEMLDVAPSHWFNRPPNRRQNLAPESYSPFTLDQAAPRFGPAQWITELPAYIITDYLGDPYILSDTVVYSANNAGVFFDRPGTYNPPPSFAVCLPSTFPAFVQTLPLVNYTETVTDPKVGDFTQSWVSNAELTITRQLVVDYVAL